MGVNNGGGGGGGGLTQGTAAAKPANPTPGQIYYATDSGELFLGNAAGNAWQEIRNAARLFSLTASGGNGGNQGLTLAAGDWLQWMSGNPIISSDGTNIHFANAGLRIDHQGWGLLVAEGANCKQGTATLAGGTVVVANTSVTANSRIMLTTQVPGGTPGALYVSARVAGTSFTVTSTSGSDTSTFAYEIFEPG